MQCVINSQNRKSFKLTTLNFEKSFRINTSSKREKILRPILNLNFLLYNLNDTRSLNSEYRVIW